LQIEFHGAAGGVTGSAHLVTTSRARVLLDFGMFQGGPPAERANRRRPGFDPRSLDAVVLSHAHIDHSGRLPLLARWGARPPIWCTPATADLCGIMLLDSAHIALQDAQRWGRKRQGRGRPAERAEVLPLYDLDDVKAVLETVRSLPYGRTREIAPGVALSFMDAGHILGSAIVVLDVAEPGARRRLVFCGDLGHSPAPLLRDPEHPIATTGRRPRRWASSAGCCSRRRGAAARCWCPRSRWAARRRSSTTWARCVAPAS
jgi:metallo-beta-lactamase family protein